MLTTLWKNTWLKFTIMSGLIMSSTSAFAMSFCGAFYLAPALQYSSYYIDDLKFQGGNLRIGAGYGGTISRTSLFYLAGEIFAIPFTATFNNNPTRAASLKTSYSFGASFIPGYFFDDSVMGYLRLGYIATRFVNIPTTKSGYEVGLGVDVNWTTNWNVFGEYDFQKYRTINGLGAPKAGIYMLGLKYKFV